MGAYIKISYSSTVAGKSNRGLKEAIEYIGKRYGKLANVEGLSSKRYEKAGIAYIAKRFGHFRKSAVKYMIYPKKIKNSESRQWCYNKQIYVRAYKLILGYLLDAPAKDMDY